MLHFIVLRIRGIQGNLENIAHIGVYESCFKAYNSHLFSQQLKKQYLHNGYINEHQYWGLLDGSGSFLKGDADQMTYRQTPICHFLTSGSWSCFTSYLCEVTLTRSVFDRIDGQMVVQE